MKVLVIGGGPAGMMAAITAAKNNNEVTLVEKMQSLGRKLLITGKGRCNLTNGENIDKFIENIPGNGMFLYSAFKKFSNTDLTNYIESLDVPLKEERGKRIFPSSDKSQDILNALKKELKKYKVNIVLNTKVTKILIDSENKVKGIETSDGKTFLAEKIILATGGKSYSATGSTGDGYTLSKQLGHTITPLFPSLVPLELYETEIYKSLMGLSLRNVSIKILDTSKNKIIYTDFGEMLFTHFGISGPIILSASSHLVRYKNITNLLSNKQIKIIIDLKPALDDDILDLRLQKDFKENYNKEFKNSLNKLLPKLLIPVILNLSKIDKDKKVHQITKDERKEFLNLLKNFTLTIKDFRPIDEAIITAGGINIKEINPSTMQSKLINGLYFAGELIDVDAYTGGFNLQIAFSTGYVAGGNN